MSSKKQQQQWVIDLNQGKKTFNQTVEALRKPVVTQIAPASAATTVTKTPVSAAVPQADTKGQRPTVRHNQAVVNSKLGGG